MGVRALRARLDCDRDTLEHLWRTHCVFNQRLPLLLTKLFAMRRGEVGTNAAQRDLYQRIARFVLARDAKDAVYLLNSVSIKGWKPATALKMKAKVPDYAGALVEVTGEDWAHDAEQLSADGLLAYDKRAERAGLPHSLFQPLTRDAVAYISGHYELVRNWEKSHADWLMARFEWEAKPEHQKYLALRPRFDAFEQSVGGKTGKRRERWHLYLDWLRANADLAAWRGGPTAVHPLDERAQRRIDRAKPWKKRSVEAQEFWKANPELAALDKLHGSYERQFIRRRKTKKNPDGFDHRPTFTMPDRVLHPRWTLFNAPQTSPQGYADLRLPTRRGQTGSVKLRLLTAEKRDGEFPTEWVTLQFRPDPRLARFRTVSRTTTYTKGKRKGETKQVDAMEFFDVHLQRWRLATISGAKLIFDRLRVNPDGSLKSATPYIVFACTIDDLPFTDRARAIQWSETGEVTRTGTRRKKKKLPPGLVTCAVDLGIRNLGFLTLAVTGEDATHNTHDGVRIIRSRNLHLSGEEERGTHPGRRFAGPDLAHIAAHKREIRRLRRLRGKPVKGERSHVDLQDHIDDMAQDRFKKAARRIVNNALNIEGAIHSTTGERYPRADVLLLEKLAGFIPDAERERGVNRALVAWNRGQLVTRIREVAADVGLKVFEIHPVGTSQCCSRCGALGRRYSIARDDESRQPVIRFGWVEKLFACPQCGYRANADHNASVNLHRRFALEDKAVQAFLDWRNLTDQRRAASLQAIDERLLPELIAIHGLAAPDALATPW